MYVLHEVYFRSVSKQSLGIYVPALHGRLTGEQLVESGGSLFCRACQETLCVKRSVVVQHVKSTKHVEGKIKLKTEQAREADLALALAEYDFETHRKGETLPEPQKVYRARVVKVLMEAGIPLSKLDCPELRDLLTLGAHAQRGLQ